MLKSLIEIEIYVDDVVVTFFNHLRLEVGSAIHRLDLFGISLLDKLLLHL